MFDSFTDVLSNVFLQLVFHNSVRLNTHTHTHTHTHTYTHTEAQTHIIYMIYKIYFI